MDLIERVKRALERRRRERQTYTELSELSDRELADIGISRYDIRAIAREAAERGYVNIYDWRDTRTTFTGGPTFKAA